MKMRLPFASPKKSLWGISAGLALCWFLFFALAQAGGQGSRADNDHDGLSDPLEQQLLLQFMPTFMIARHDCSMLPAEFSAGSVTPDVVARNGVVYGQVFPVKSPVDGSTAVELHYYDLWQKDCGLHGHPLDTEHVAVLVQPSSPHLDSARWKALYWYAAAHENTVCDVSQIARASTLRAEDRGATIWISPGKHASYLSSDLCQGGCGADRCVKMTEFHPTGVVNLGEPGFPLNGSVFIASKAWPLASKMSTSNFPAAAIARLNQLPATEIASFNPGRHPVQGIIATGSTTEQSIALGEADTAAAIEIGSDSTGDALSDARGSTGGALSTATAHTGNALQKTYRHTLHALGLSTRQVGQALHLSPAQNPNTAQAVRPQKGTHHP